MWVLYFILLLNGVPITTLLDRYPTQAECLAMGEEVLEGMLAAYPEDDPATMSYTCKLTPQPVKGAPL